MIWLTLLALGVTCCLIARNNETEHVMQQCRHVHLRRNVTTINNRCSSKSSSSSSQMAALRANIRRVAP